MALGGGSVSSSLGGLVRAVSSSTERMNGPVESIVVAKEGRCSSIWEVDVDMLRELHRVTRRLYNKL